MDYHEILHRYRCPSKIKCYVFFKIYFFGLYGFIDRTAEDTTGIRMREEKASVHSAPALPTELNGTPCYVFLMTKMTFSLTSCLICL